MKKFVVKTALVLSLTSVCSLIVFPVLDISKPIPAYIETTDLPSISQEIVKNHYKPPSK